MADTNLNSEDRALHFNSAKRDLQLWSILVLALGLMGIALAFYGILSASSLRGWTPEQLSQLVPPLLFGIFSLLLLVNLYVARREMLVWGLQRELVQQKIAAELNQELALLDPVTEVYNRRYLRMVLIKEGSRAKRYGKPLLVMLVDITGFRHVNESLGQTGGDVVLKQIAHLIQASTRNSDYVIRYGGDEFLLVLPDTSGLGVEQLASRLKDSLAEWSRHSGISEFNLKFAIGTAQFSPEKPWDEILKLTEQRMFQDRRPGREEGRRSHSVVTTERTTP